MNLLLLIWVLVLALCFLGRYVFENRNVQASLLLSFLGLFLLGMGLASIGRYYAVLNALNEEWSQSILDVFLIFTGTVCVWIASKPLTQIVQSWFK